MLQKLSRGVLISLRAPEGLAQALPVPLRLFKQGRAPMESTSVNSASKPIEEVRHSPPLAPA